LTELSFGPSADLMVGETVIAIGHPFGYTNTVSTGIISAVGREVTMPNGDSLTNLIQTNASINPGNSGGPMLNINGELIGINVALREGAQGIAFALNADSVQQALAGHLSAARVAGVNHGCTCSETVREEGVARQQVVLDRVQRDGPGDLAGLRRGDVLIRVGGRPIANRFDLERAFWNARTGDKVELRVIRDGREMRATLTLDAAEGVDVARGASSAVRPVAAEEDSRTARPRR
jgi:serine protease Do